MKLSKMRLFGLSRFRSVQLLHTVGFISLLLILAGCRHSKPQPTPREDRLVIFAASSLRDAFGHASDEFKTAHPGVEVTFNFAGTQAIRSQIEQGAPADVFAAADERHMKALQESGKVNTSQLFARNEPVIIVVKERATDIRSLADLPKAKKIVAGAPEVPIGKYTLRILDNASRRLGSDFRSRVEARIVSRELNVRQVLSKVALGEADAAIVYRTDIGSNRENVSVVTIPPEFNVVAEYPIATVKSSLHPNLAHQWVSFVLSERGQGILRESGFMVHYTLEAAN